MFKDCQHELMRFFLEWKYRKTCWATFFEFGDWIHQQLHLSGVGWRLRVSQQRNLITSLMKLHFTSAMTCANVAFISKQWGWLMVDCVSNGREFTKWLEATDWRKLVHAFYTSKYLLVRYWTLNECWMLPPMACDWKLLKVLKMHDLSKIVSGLFISVNIEI